MAQKSLNKYNGSQEVSKIIIDKVQLKNPLINKTVFGGRLKDQLITLQEAKVPGLKEIENEEEKF